MDAESISAIKLLEVIGGIRAQMIHLSAEVRKQPGVKETVSGVELRTYRDAYNVSPTMLDMYVEATLQSDNVVCWEFTLNWDDSSWMIYADVDLLNSQGHDSLKDFPDWTASTLQELCEHLQDMASKLIESAKDIDLTAI